MVIMSFKLKRVLIPVKKRDRETKLDKLKKEFGSFLKIYTEKGYVVVEGDDLKDYRVCDRIYEILGV